MQALPSISNETGSARRIEVPKGAQRRDHGYGEKQRRQNEREREMLVQQCAGRGAGKQQRENRQMTGAADDRDEREKIGARVRTALSAQKAPR